MPSEQKTLHYLGSALLTAIAVGLLGFGMSAEWSATKFACSIIQNGTLETNNVALTMGLFIGVSKLNMCPFSDNGNTFEVIPQLVESEVTPAALQITVVFLLALCLLCSAGTILISLYNSVSNPYETYLGPLGIYTCNSLSAVFSLLVLILNACNVFLANSPGVFVKHLNVVEPDSPFSSLRVGYFMAIPYLVLSLLSIAVIYMYHHSAYRHRTEQQKPTQDAPMDTMMY